MTRSHAILLALLVALAACKGPGGRGDARGERSEPDPRTLVDAAPAAPGAVSAWVVSSGTVESEIQVDLVPEASGVVTAIHVEEGDPVTRGQVLALIENPNLDATLTRAEAELARSEQAYGELERLAQAGAVSARDLADAHTALLAARANFDEARRSKAFTRITSPVDGVVSARDIKVGETASPARRTFQVVNPGRLRVPVPLPERDLPHVRPGLNARMFPVYAPDDVYEARVTRLSPTVDPSTGTFRAFVVPSDDVGDLKPGQYLSVRIEVDRHEDALLVPRKAVLYEEGVPYVFRVDPAPPEEEPEGAGRKPAPWWKGLAAKAKARLPGNKDTEKDQGPPGPKRVAKKIDLQLGFLDVEVAEVLSGLAEGDLVVTVGQETLRDGARIRLPGDPTAKDAEDEAGKKAGEGG
ncbi:MAG: efflux RND transporter periplasmic adaptor subunit [Deltaproteobacteria bacterium]|nr:efflux RND transporter periplasmic adaptor subunit [Deltaproteobacteria bacterium]